MTDLKLSYDITGPKTGEAVIFLHAIGTNRHLWDRQQEMLRSSFRTIRADLPGHGETPVPDCILSIFEISAAVLGLMDELSLEAAHVVGASLGGMVGMALAIDNPERVLSLTAADVRADAPKPYREMWDQLIAMAETQGMQAVAAFMKARWFGETPTGSKNDMRCVSDALNSTSVSGFVASARAIQQMDFAHRVAEISVPSLLLVGENDGVLPRLMLDMCQGMPHAKFVEIKGAGHLPNIDQPGAFDDALTGFLWNLR